MRGKNLKKILKRNENGFGMTEALVAATIGLVVLFSINGAMTQIMKGSSKVNSTLDLSAIKSELIQSVDCKVTLATPCTDGSYIDLQTGSLKTVVSAAGTKRGKFMVRARCSQIGQDMGIDVRVAWLTQAGSANPLALDFNSTDDAWFRHDEVNANLKYNWSHPKAKLFTGANELCKTVGNGNSIMPGWPNGIKCRGVGSNAVYGQFFYISGLGRNGIPTLRYVDPYTHTGVGAGAYGLEYSDNGNFYGTLGGSTHNMADCFGKSVTELTQLGQVF